MRQSVEADLVFRATSSLLRLKTRLMYGGKELIVSSVFDGTQTVAHRGDCCLSGNSERDREAFIMVVRDGAMTGAAALSNRQFMPSSPVALSAFMDESSPRTKASDMGWKEKVAVGDDVTSPFSSTKLGISVDFCLPVNLFSAFHISEKLFLESAELLMTSVNPVAADPTPTTEEGCRSQPGTSSRGAAMFMLPLHKNSYTEHVQTAHSVSPPSVASHNQLESGSPHVDSCSVTRPGSFVSRRSYRRTSARYPARQVSPPFVSPAAARCNLAPTWRPLMMQDLKRLTGGHGGRVSNGSWLQLADESSARRAGVIKADLERNQVIRQLAASIRTGTSTSPSMDPLGKTDAQVCGSQIRNLLSTLNKSTRRPPCQL
ncbi:hypothetical protein Bbelb_097180 [Branchiostoma belcheri]|nr:hypothetical protein Bbelb_097180 [Branchiostoma belcheri]